MPDFPAPLIVALILLPRLLHMIWHWLYLTPLLLEAESILHILNLLARHHLQYLNSLIQLSLIALKI